MRKDEKGRAAQVRQQLATLEKAIGRLHNNIDALEAGLHPILTEDTRSKPAAPDVQPELVPLALELSALEDRVTIAANRILFLVNDSEL